jgi:hypothetical protein
MSCSRSRQPPRVGAELGRRNPAPEDAEFTADEIANALGESRGRADELMGTADRLDSHLPGTQAALRDGTLSLGKARIIAIATGLLDPDEARAAENEVLDRAGRLTRAGCAPRSPAQSSRSPPRRHGNAARPRRSSPGWSGGSRTPATPP